jgi:hypothetical protein
MPDLVIVASDVLAMPGSRQVGGISAGTPNAGDVMFKSPDDGLWRRAAANSAVNGGKIPSGIALNTAGADQPVDVLTEGRITISAVMNPGTTYYLSPNVGKMCPRGDLAAGMDVCVIGIAISQTVLVVDFIVPGVTL